MTAKIAKQEAKPVSEKSRQTKIDGRNPLGFGYLIQ